MAELPIDLTDTPIPEETTQKLAFRVLDEDEVAIPGASLLSLTVTLFTADTETIINTRNDTDILGANGGTVPDANGDGNWIMTPADNAIINGAKFEDHIALLEWTYGTGPKQGRQPIRLRVVNLAKVP